MTTTASTEIRHGTGCSPYESLVEHVREAHLLGGTVALMEWDQEVLMPPAGIEHRGRQLALLAGLHHERMIDPRVGDWLDACEQDDGLIADPTSVEAVNIRELRRQYDRRTKLPVALVQEEARLSSEGQHCWVDARRAADFDRFRPVFERIITLLRRKAECYGWAEDGEPWDALAEDYEPGCTAKTVETVFTPLRARLQVLLDDLMGSSTPPSAAFHERKVPIEAQKRFVRHLAQRLGFDFERGRLDVSTHPFCTGTHSRDIRITGRYREAGVADALGTIMHEAGHGIYEQGLLHEHTGTPMAEPVSLGIHESQSRMWENQVGRSRAFWRWCLPVMGEFFGDAMDGFDLDEVHGAVNIVRPDFIRVEADEATYNMHVMIRFELERALMNGSLDLADLPATWNEKYRQSLGVEVPDDAKGCLQDVHWSMCSVGYFPTYTLGNLYAAQLFEAAREAIPDLDKQFAEGEFTPLRTWLNEHIHVHGMRYRAADLCEHVTGRVLEAEPLMRHLDNTFRPIYGV